MPPPPPPSPYAPVYVTNRAKFSLLSPAHLETPLDMPQQITGTYGNQEFVMQAWVSADEYGVTMSLFNGFGASLGELSFTETGISLVSGVFPASAKPEYIIADFQFCFYRADALSHALKSCGLTLETRRNGQTEIRTIRERKEKIVEIEKTSEMIRYTNHLRKYAYTLEGVF
jgi:hypothetical protein